MMSIGVGGSAKRKCPSDGTDIEDIDSGSSLWRVMRALDMVARVLASMTDPCRIPSGGPKWMSKSRWPPAVRDTSGMVSPTDAKSWY